MHRIRDTNDECININCNITNDITNDIINRMEKDICNIKENSKNEITNEILKTAYCKNLESFKKIVNTCVSMLYTNDFDIIDGDGILTILCKNNWTDAIIYMDNYGYELIEDAICNNCKNYFEEHINQ